MASVGRQAREWEHGKRTDKMDRETGPQRGSCNQRGTGLSPTLVGSPSPLHFNVPHGSSQKLTPKARILVTLPLSHVFAPEAHITFVAQCFSEGLGTLMYCQMHRSLPPNTLCQGKLETGKGWWHRPEGPGLRVSWARGDLSIRRSMVANACNSLQH